MLNASKDGPPRRSLFAPAPPPPPAATHASRVGRVLNETRSASLREQREKGSVGCARAGTRTPREMETHIGSGGGEGDDSSSGEGGRRGEEGELGEHD